MVDSSTEVPVLSPPCDWVSSPLENTFVTYRFTAFRSHPSALEPSGSSNSENRYHAGSTDSTM